MDVFRIIDSASYFGAFWTALGCLILVGAVHSPGWRSTPSAIVAWSISAVCAGLLTWYVTGGLNGILLPLLVSVGLALLVRHFARILTPLGCGVLANRLYLPVCGSCILYNLGVEHDWHIATQVILGLPALLGIGAMIKFTVFDGTSGLYVRHPRRDAAFDTIMTRRGKTAPKVSIHVPCYSEPPSLVMSTLNAISNIKYPNFEVLVVDNNTKDNALWLPVEAHCRTLGDRFRFYHVDPLPGAKAGALNFALGQSSRESEIIVVVDADYLAEPDFLDKYMPLFEDPNTAFVQTSHDYREWEDSRFLTGAYYEYVPFHKTSLPSLNEYSSGFTVGTMCLLRREALEQAGGWDESCLTEDSEIAIRLHALGYVGHTFGDTSGRGFIPETMVSLKRQQFRWTAGPIQQLLKHWRLYLGISRDGRLSLPQGLLEIFHSMARVPIVLNLMMSVIIPAYCLYALTYGYNQTVRPYVLAIFGAGLAKNFAENYVTVRLAGGSRLTHQIYSTIMRSALEWTYVCGVVAPFMKSELAWLRTNKFKETFSIRRAFSASRSENILALVHFGAGLAFLPFASFAPLDIVALTAIWLLLRGLSFGCTLLVSLVSEYELYANSTTISEPRIALSS